MLHVPKTFFFSSCVIEESRDESYQGKRKSKEMKEIRGFNLVVIWEFKINKGKVMKGL